MTRNGLRLVKIIKRAGWARRNPLWCYRCKICGTEHNIIQGWRGPPPPGWPHVSCHHEEASFAS